MNEFNSTKQLFKQTIRSMKTFKIDLRNKLVFCTQLSIFPLIDTELNIIFKREIKIVSLKSIISFHRSFEVISFSYTEGRDLLSFHLNFSTFHFLSIHFSFHFARFRSVSVRWIVLQCIFALELVWLRFHWVRWNSQRNKLVFGYCPHIERKLFYLYKFSLFFSLHSACAFLSWNSQFDWFC